MRKVIKPLLLFLFLTIGCSEEQSSEIEQLETTKQIEGVDTGLIDEAAKTSGGSCGGNVDFGDLLVETSWISGEKGDREQFSACGIDGEDWMDKYSDGRFMLKCLREDGQRTELKEDNGYEANLTQYKRIRFTAKFSSIPSNGVTVAQVHNRDSGVKRPWLRLYIDKNRKFKIKETETDPTASSSDYSTYEGMTYTSNEEVEITVWTGTSGDEKAKIRVDYNNERFEKKLYPSDDWNSHADHFYLKAGVYTEGDDKEAKVTYSKFEIKY